MMVREVAGIIAKQQEMPTLTATSRKDVASKCESNEARGKLGSVKVP